MNKNKLDINVVTTLYKSSSYIEEFTSRMIKTLESTGLTYKIIFVNDGSPDNSAEVVRKIIKKNRSTLISINYYFISY